VPLLRDVMTAILVCFERHGGCPGSGTGPWYTVQSSPPNHRSVQQGLGERLLPRTNRRAACIASGDWKRITGQIIGYWPTAVRPVVSHSPTLPSSNHRSRKPLIQPTTG
jgi:hypothetical protein